MPDWLRSQEQIVRENFRARGAKWCANETGHTVSAVYRRAHLLGVARKKADHVIQPTPQVDLMIRNAYGAGRIGACKEIERATGLPRRWISDRAHQLGLRLRGAQEVRFTPEQVAFIGERMHRSARTIAQDLRREMGWKGPQRAVATQLVALRRAKDDDDRMSATQVAEIFGVPITTVTGWVKRGWLIAERVRGYGHGFRVEEADLALFIVNHPSAITLGKLEADKAWFIDLLTRLGRYEGRQDASIPRRIQSIAAADPGRTPDEIAALVGVSRGTVLKALRRPAAVEARQAA